LKTDPVTGIAAATKEKLEKLGYKVIDIDTADEQREKSLFKFKTAKIGFKDMFLQDVAEFLPESDVEEGVETENEYDLLLIVGSTQKL